MDFTQTFMLVAELVGTFAFAFSGSIVAVQKHLDIFGIVVLGVITAVGGGMIRDITLGVIPPVLFRAPIYVVVATCTSVLVFCLCFWNVLSVEKTKQGIYKKLLNIMDAIGLGVFTVVGVNAAVQAGFKDKAFLAVAVGTITGIGGGILRDLLAMRTPVVLHKHVYAVASIAGGIVYYYFMLVIPDSAALIIGVGMVVIIRTLATHYEWNLPAVKS